MVHMVVVGNGANQHIIHVTMYEDGALVAVGCRLTPHFAIALRGQSAIPRPAALGLLGDVRCHLGMRMDRETWSVATQEINVILRRLDCGAKMKTSHGAGSSTAKRGGQHCMACSQQTCSALQLLNSTTYLVILLLIHHYAELDLGST
jgi:hypothetical protein